MQAGYDPLCLAARDRGSLAMGGGLVKKLVERLFDAILGQSLARLSRRRYED